MGHGKCFFSKIILSLSASLDQALVNNTFFIDLRVIYLVLPPFLFRMTFYLHLKHVIILDHDLLLIWKTWIFDDDSSCHVAFYLVALNQGLCLLNGQEAASVNLLDQIVFDDA